MEFQHFFTAVFRVGGVPRKMPFLVVILAMNAIFGAVFFKNWSVEFRYFKQQWYLHRVHLIKAARKDSVYFVWKKIISKLVLAKFTGRTTQETPLKPTDLGGWDKSRKLLCRICSYHNFIIPRQSSVYDKIQKKFCLFGLEHWIHTFICQCLGLGFPVKNFDS